MLSYTVQNMNKYLNLLLEQPVWNAFKIKKPLQCNAYGKQHQKLVLKSKACHTIVCDFKMI